MDEPDFPVRGRANEGVGGSARGREGERRKRWKNGGGKKGGRVGGMEGLWLVGWVGGREGRRESDLR